MTDRKSEAKQPQPVQQGLLQEVAIGEILADQQLKESQVRKG